MAPRAKTNEEILREKWAANPEKLVRVPRVEKVGERGYVTYGGQLLPKAPVAPRFAGNVSFKEIALTDSEGNPLLDDVGRPQVQLIQEPNEPNFGATDDSLPFLSSQYKKNKIVQSIIKDINRVPKEGETNFLGANKILDERDFEVTPRNLLQEAAINVWQGFAGGGDIRRLQHMANEHGIGVKEIQDAMNVDRIAKLRDTPYGDTGLTLQQAFEGKKIPLMDDQGRPILGRNSEGGLQQQYRTIEYGDTEYELVDILTKWDEYQAKKRNYPTQRADRKALIDASVFPNLDKEARDLLGRRRESQLAGARHSDVLDRTARLENKVEQQGVKAELKAIEAERRAHEKDMALLRLRNKGALTRAQKEYDYLKEVRKYEDAERLRREGKEAKKDLWRTIEELSEKETEGACSI